MSQAIPEGALHAAASRPSSLPFKGREARRLIGRGSPPQAVLALLALLAGPAPVRADAAPPGATSCSGCHAVRATSDRAVPPIHGRPAEEIVAALLAFRADERPATVMNRLAKGFSPDEIRAIAAWMSAQR